MSLKEVLQEGIDQIVGLEQEVIGLENELSRVAAERDRLVTEMSTMIKVPAPREQSIERLIAAGLVLDALAIPYVFGGETRTGMDCSGFTQFLFKQGAGVALPRTSKDQAKVGTEIDKSDMTQWLRGDLVFFDYSGDGVVDHVGIYLGDGSMLHTNTPATGINIKPVGKPVAVRRIL